MDIDIDVDRGKYSSQKVGTNDGPEGLLHVGFLEGPATGSNGCRTRFRSPRIILLQASISSLLLLLGFGSRPQLLEMSRPAFPPSHACCLGCSSGFGLGHGLLHQGWYAGCSVF